MKVLVLPLKAKYFTMIRQRVKLEEYRLVNEYWRKRLEGKSYDAVEFTLGYPKRGDAARRFRRAWIGKHVKTIQHPLFGESPVKVFAIIAWGRDLPLEGE